jgi:hypothetical protein
VRRASKHSALGVDQAFYAVSGTIEAARQLRHLIVPLNLDPCGEVSSTERLDPSLEPFEASCDPPDDGIGPKRDSDGQEAKRY